MGLMCVRSVLPNIIRNMDGHIKPLGEDEQGHGTVPTPHCVDQVVGESMLVPLSISPESVPEWCQPAVWCTIIVFHIGQIVGSQPSWPD